MSKNPIALAALSLGFLYAAFGCSSPAGSTVSYHPPSNAGAKSSGGSGGASVGVPKGGSASTSPPPSTPGVISGEACPGLPIQPTEATPTDGGANAGGASGEAGAPSEEPASGGTGGQSAEACLGVSLEAEAVPVDLFIMMDRSQSMGNLVEGSSLTRWDALRDAVQGFVEDPGAGNVRMGLGFFSLTGTANDDLDCDVEGYAKPSVPIGELSEIGQDLVSAIDDITPAGLTPTVPALQGAIKYAQAWATEHPDRATLVVLVTDGYPTQCSSAPEAIALTAKLGYESPQHIRTFVIGVGDVARFNLDNYARSGGTRRAFLTDSGDITRTFVEALGNIRNRELACEYQIPTPPEGMKLDASKVQVVYSPATGAPEEVPSIDGLQACANNPNGGWYYDYPANPSKIVVCPCTCARFQAGKVDVRLGCKPRLGLR
jgi:von Willebrand factor type A domain-containing protein